MKESIHDHNDIDTRCIHCHAFKHNRMHGFDLDDGWLCKGCLMMPDKPGSPWQPYD